MITTPDSSDQLVFGYLDAAERALTGVPEDRRRELLRDLSDHIAAERAALDPPTEAGVRAILDRLGDPATVAAEARVPEAGSPSPAVATVAAKPARRRPGTVGWVLIAIGLTLLTGLVVCIAGFAIFAARVGPVSEPVPASTVAPQPAQT